MFNREVYYRTPPMANNAQYLCGSGCPSTQDLAYGGCSYSQDQFYSNCGGGARPEAGCYTESYFPQFWPACDGPQCPDGFSYGKSAPLTRTMYAASSTWNSPQPAAYFPWNNERITHGFHELWNRGIPKQKDLVDVVFPKMDQEFVLPGPGYNLALKENSLRGHSRLADACNC